MKVIVEGEKVSLKLNIQKTKIIASGPITSWEIDGETVETVSDFIFWSIYVHITQIYTYTYLIYQIYIRSDQISHSVMSDSL